MDFERFVPYLVFFFAGLGLLLVAGGNLLFGRVPGWGGAVLTLVGSTTAGAGTWACGGDLRAVATAGGLVSLGATACALAGADQLTTVLAFVLAVLRRPAGRWATLAFVGLATTTGSAALYTMRDEQAVAGQTAEMELLSARPETSPVPVRAATDRGSTVELGVVTAPRSADILRAGEERMFCLPGQRDAVLRRQPANDRSNCHGWVFGGGQFWIPGTAVDLILNENGYHRITDPRPGDLVVYRLGGAVAHTAVVRYVTEGMPVLVEGKWGWAGIFLHPVDKSIYGNDFIYYRSARPGHSLVGIGPSPLPSPRAD